MQLEADFEEQLEQAVLDDAEHQFVGEQNNLVYQTVEKAHERLRRWGEEADYDVEPVIESFGGVTADRSDGEITVRYGWEHPAAPYFEFGTSDHTVDGDPVLSFVWENPPDWVREEFDQARSSGGQFASGYRVFFSSVDVSGIKETRFGRHALDWLRREVGN